MILTLIHIIIHEKLIFTKKDFKDVAAGYKEKIKELESEIKAVVEEAGGDLSLKADKIVPEEDV